MVSVKIITCVIFALCFVSVKGHYEFKPFDITRLDPFDTRQNMTIIKRYIGDNAFTMVYMDTNYKGDACNVYPWDQETKFAGKSCILQIDVYERNKLSVVNKYTKCIRTHRYFYRYGSFADYSVITYKHTTPQYYVDYTDHQKVFKQFIVKNPFMGWTKCIFYNFISHYDGRNMGTVTAMCDGQGHAVYF